MQAECLARREGGDPGVLQTYEKFLSLAGGWGGIRTHGRLHVAGFQDRCLKQLGHPSVSSTAFDAMRVLFKPAGHFALIARAHCWRGRLCFPCDESSWSHRAVAP